MEDKILTSEISHLGWPGFPEKRAVATGTSACCMTEHERKAEERMVGSPRE